MRNSYIMMYPSQYQEPLDHIKKLGDKVYDAAFQVHRKWGPGLLELFITERYTKSLRKTA
jgi:hypothetical protein